MSVPTVYTIVVLAAVGAGFCLLQLRRAVRESRNRDRTNDARQRVGLPPAAADNLPGTHLADLDECELIWATPGPDDPDWLRDAVRDAVRDAIEHRGDDPA